MLAAGSELLAELERFEVIGWQAVKAERADGQATDEQHRDMGVSFAALDALYSRIRLLLGDDATGGWVVDWNRSTAVGVLQAEEWADLAPQATADQDEEWVLMAMIKADEEHTSFGSPDPSAFPDVSTWLEGLRKLSSNPRTIYWTENPLREQYCALLRDHTAAYLEPWLASRLSSLHADPPNSLRPFGR